jgi:hypothetical protein
MTIYFAPGNTVRKLYVVLQRTPLLALAPMSLFFHVGECHAYLAIQGNHIVDGDFSQ